MEEEEENWFDKEDDEEMPTVASPQSEEKLIAAKYNDVDMIDTLKRTSNNSVAPLSPNNSAQPQTVKKLTDSPPKTTPLTSMTSVAPSVNSRKVNKVFYFSDDIWH